MKTWLLLNIFVLFTFVVQAKENCSVGGFCQIEHEEEVKPEPKLLSIEEFYKKTQYVKGLVVKGSQNIELESLKKASDIIERMISKREDIRRRLISNNADIAIIAKNENYCDIPEARSLKNLKTFDGRDFCSICGGGGTLAIPVTTVCEDNLLKTKSDPYLGTEDILTHEFAHTMHILGMDETDKATLTALYQNAKEEKVFDLNARKKPTYLMANEQEYFACMSAIWFGVHNSKSLAMPPKLVDRQSIKMYQPAMYEFLKSIYPEE